MLEIDDPGGDELDAVSAGEDAIFHAGVERGKFSRGSPRKLP
jgi:hypothetical protein